MTQPTHKIVPIEKIDELPFLMVSNSPAYFRDDLLSMLASCHDVESEPVALGSIQESVFDKMVMAFKLPRSHDDALPIDDTQLGVEFALDEVKQFYAAPQPASVTEGNRVAELEEDLNKLNRYLREKGMGQGEIDSISSLYEDIATLEAKLAENERLFTLLHDAILKGEDDKVLLEYAEAGYSGNAKSKTQPIAEVVAEFTQIEKLEDDNAKLSYFARAIIFSGEYPFTDLDGMEIQELALKHGLIEQLMMNERCGQEYCGCAEYGFPAECCRATDLINKIGGTE